MQGIKLAGGLPEPQWATAAAVRPGAARTAMGHRRRRRGAWGRPHRKAHGSRRGAWGRPDHNGP